MIPFPHYGDFTAFTPVVPELYWNVYSAEERVKALCMEWVKLTAYTQALADTVNEQYDDLKADIQERYDALDAAVQNIDDVVTDMNERFPELVNEQVNVEIRRLVNSGEFAEMLQAAIDEYWTEYEQRIIGVETGLTTLSGELTTERNARIAEDSSIRSDFADDIDKYSYAKNNVIYYGADPTGNADSTSAIQNCINANNGSTIYMSPGTYKISSTIELPFDMGKHVSINGLGSELVAADDFSEFFKVGSIRTDTIQNWAGFDTSTIENITLRANEHTINAGIDIVNGFKDLHIVNVCIHGVLNGIVIGHASGDFFEKTPNDTLIDRCLIYGKGSEYNGIGVYSYGTDNYMSDTRIYGFATCIHVAGTITAINTHGLLRWKNQDASGAPWPINSEEWLTHYNNTNFIVAETGCRFVNCYADSMFTVVKGTTTGIIELVNQVYYNPRPNVGFRIFDFSKTTSFNLILTSSNLILPTGSVPNGVERTGLISNGINVRTNVLKLEDTSVTLRALSFNDPLACARNAARSTMAVSSQELNTWYVAGIIPYAGGLLGRNTKAINLSAPGYIATLYYSAAANGSAPARLTLDKHLSLSERYDIGIYAFLNELTNTYSHLLCFRIKTDTGESCGITIDDVVTNTPISALHSQATPYDSDITGTYGKLVDMIPGANITDFVTM